MVSLKKKKPEIDLKKDRETGLDLEKKIDFDADSGGLGISFDVAELENGDKISIGYEVEAPIQVGVDYNVDSNELGLSGGFEAPGDLVGLSGGVTIDLNSGEIVGGELGVALGGVDVSIGEGKCERTISISIAGVTTTYTQKKDDPGCGDDDENDDDDDDSNDDDDPQIPKPPPTPQIPGDPLDPVYVIIDTVSYYYNMGSDPDTGFSWSDFSESDVSTTIAGSYLSSIKKYKSKFTPYNIPPTPPEIIEGTDITYAPLDMFKPWANDLIFPGVGPIPDYILESPDYRATATLYHYMTYIAQANVSLRWNNDVPKQDLGWKKFGGWARAKLTYYKNLKTGEEGPPPPEPPKNTPITPPEKDDMKCCDLEPVLSMLRKMNKVLAIDEMDGEGVKIPKRLFVTNGKGYEECKTYPAVLATQIRIADHLGIHPYKAQIDDSNAAQAGNQKLEVQVINATAAAKMISELLLENKGDAATRLNLLVRNTVATGQILNAVAIAAKRIREVMRFLAIPVKEQIDYINMPFDFSFGNRDKKKGFQAGAKPAEALDINTEEATEKMLPKFMVNSKQPYVVEIFDDKQGTLLDILLKQSK
jgi:hypothetical protein